MAPDELSPEASLLLAVTSPGCEPGDIGRALEACTDWDRLLRLARLHDAEHQLAVLLDRLQHVERLDAPVREHVEKLRVRALFLDRFRVMFLSELLESFDRAGIPCMLLKGLGLAERLFDAPSERMSRDIDLLVPRASLEAASDLLRGLGFEAVRESVYRENHFHIIFTRREGRLINVVELHWDITFPNSVVRFDMQHWWDHATRARLRAGEVLLPPSPDELLYLCHHVFSSGAVTLHELSSVARLYTQTSPTLSWTDVLERAKSTHTTFFMHHALRLCERLWGLDIRDLPGPDSSSGFRQWLARDLSKPAAIISEGKHRWWPFREIRYWSLLPPEGGVSELFRRGTFDWQFLLSGVRSSGRLYRSRKTLSLLFALALCCLPGPQGKA